MTRRQWDRALGLVFSLVGAAVAFVGVRLPIGMAGVPGPGVFPIGIGLVLAVLGLALIAAARDGDPYFDRGWRAPTSLRVVATVLLLVAHVATWSVLPFGWRTSLLLVALYRLFGEGWLRSVAFAGVVTGAMVIVFQVLFRVRF